MDAQHRKGTTARRSTRTSRRTTGAAIAGIASVAAVSALMTACGSDGGATASESGPPRVALLINGTLGDGGFFDQAAAGVEAGAETTGSEFQIIETGYEPTRWEPALNDAASGDFDLIIAGSYPMKELVQQAARQHPDKQFALFDVEADLDACGCDNIYSMTFRYRETGFLAGALAGLLQSEDVDRLNAEQDVVGVVGGQDIPVINDYIAGFEAGVAYASPDTEVLSAYAGSFTDPVRGKAIATDMTGQGADIVFTAAGATDKGVIEAAAGGGWAIGNSIQQAEQPEVSGEPVVLTSSATTAANAIQEAVELAGDDALPTGEMRTFGVADGTNHIVESATYTAQVPQSVRTRMQEIQQDIADGKLDAELG